MNARDELVAKILQNTLDIEGWPAYTNRPADRGGPTKGGITLRTLSKWRGRPCTPADLMALTLSEAQEIYYHQYIAPWEFLTYDPLMEVCIDYAITSWHDNPTLALQQIVGVEQDGILGPITRREILRYPDQEFLRRRVLANRLRYMVSLAVDDPKLRPLIRGHSDLQLLNLRGWINRVTDQI